MFAKHITGLVQFCLRLRSQGLGVLTLGHLRLLLSASLYLSFSRPVRCFFCLHTALSTVAVSGYGAWSSILMTSPVQRSWALISIDSILCESTLRLNPLLLMPSPPLLEDGGGGGGLVQSPLFKSVNFMSIGMELGIGNF